MKPILTIVLILIAFSFSFAQKKENQKILNQIQEIQEKKQVSFLKTQEKLKNIEYKYKELQNNHKTLEILYQHTNDRLDNYLTFTGIIASIFGVLIALAGIYIGFESLRSQNRRKDAIKTLEEAKAYVTTKKADFDTLIESKKQLLQKEYDNILKLLKGKLLNDIEIETSKVKTIVEIKSDEIQKLSVEEQHNKTIELFEKRLEFFENVGIPDDPEILLSKAKILRDKKMHKEAILLLERLVEQDSNHKEAYWYLGSEYAQINNNELSIKNYKKELELNPNSSSALNNIALRFKAKGNYLDALEYLDKAIILLKKELYYTNRIDILIHLNSNTRAIRDYIQLISINPDKAAYYRSLLSLLKQESRNGEIIIYFDKAINHFKETNLDLSNDFNYSKALYLGSQGNEKNSIEIFQKLIDEDYKIENCYINIAELKNKIGKTNEAKSILTNGIKSNPLYSNLYLYKALIEVNDNQEDAKKAIDEGGEVINTENYYYLGGRLFNKKNQIYLSQYCYEGALNLIREKISTDKIEEGDIMNFYETLIILQKPLTEFEEKYRKLVVSEEYKIVLCVLDAFNKLFKNFSSEEKNIVLQSLRDLNIETKDKDLINWNFNDIYWYIKGNKDTELAKFSLRVIKYIQQEIEYSKI